MTKLASAHMPLLERLRKGANCVVFLDGAPEPAADVADMLRKAAAEIARLHQQIEDAEIALNVWDSVHDSEYWLRHPKDPGDLVAAALSTSQPKEGER